MGIEKKKKPLDEKAEQFFSKIIKEISRKRLDDLIVIGIKTRGDYLGRRLVRRIKEQMGKEVQFGTIDITLYRDDFENRKNWPQLRTTSIPEDVKEKDIILVDDVLYTGRTVRAAINSIMDYGRPSSIRLAVLVDRGGRELPVQADYTGITIDASSDEMVNVCLEEVDGCEEIEITRKNGV